MNYIGPNIVAIIYKVEILSINFQYWLNYGFTLEIFAMKWLNTFSDIGQYCQSANVLAVVYVNNITISHGSNNTVLLLEN